MAGIYLVLLRVAALDLTDDGENVVAHLELESMLARSREEGSS
jgi:hypothetical protein